MTEWEWLHDIASSSARMIKWALAQTDWGGGPNGRRLERIGRLFACACCRQCWGKMPDRRSRNAVVTAERYADRLASVDDMDAAFTAALAVDPTAHNNPAAVAANLCAIATGIEWVEVSFTNAITSLVHPHHVWVALVREIFGNPFRSVAPPEVSPHCPHCGAKRWTAIDVDEMACLDCLKRWPWPNDAYTCPWLTWNDGLVARLAATAYEERPEKCCQQCDGKGVRFSGTGKSVWQEECPACYGTGRIEDGVLDPDRLAILADALEEAGCRDEDILRHLRGWERCWLCQRTGSDPDKDACSVCGQLGDRGPFGKPCAPGWVRIGVPHVRGCWALDLVHRQN